jgi:tetratricopeptide (TPR) repeat protein
MDDDITNPEIWKKQGDNHFKDGRYEEAIKCYKEAIDLDPNYKSAWNNLGFAYFKTGQLDEAKKCKDKIKSLDTPSFPEPKPIDQSYPTISQETPSQPNVVRIEKNPGIAALCSFFIPGLGQLYNGEVGKGVVILFGTIIGALFFLIPGILVWVFGIYDAHKTAKKMNSGDIQYKSTNTIAMILFGLMAVATVVIVSAAIIAAFVFGMSGTTDVINGDNTVIPVQTTQPTIQPTILSTRRATPAPIATETPFNMYSNSKYQFYIGYPKNWVKTDYKEPYLEIFGSIYYMFPYTLVDFAPNNNRDNVLSSVMIDDATDTTIERYYVKYVSELENDYFIDITKHHAQVPLSNHMIRGYRIDYTRKSKQDTSDIKKVIQVFTIDNEVVYILNFEATPAEYDKQLSQFERMIESFGTQ